MGQNINRYYVPEHIPSLTTKPHSSFINLDPHHVVFLCCFVKIYIYIHVDSKVKTKNIKIIFTDIQHHHLPSHHSSVWPCYLATPTWHIISSQYHKSLHYHSHKVIIDQCNSTTWLYKTSSHTPLYNASLHIQTPIAQCDPATWLSNSIARPIPDNPVRPCRRATIPHYLT